MCRPARNFSSLAAIARMTTHSYIFIVEGKQDRPIYDQITKIVWGSPNTTTYSVYAASEIKEEGVSEQKTGGGKHSVKAICMWMREKEPAQINKFRFFMDKDVPIQDQTNPF